MFSHSNVKTFLCLPPEIRRIIFLKLFQSVRIRRKAGGAEHLAISTGVLPNLPGSSAARSLQMYLSSASLDEGGYGRWIFVTGLTFNLDMEGDLSRPSSSPIMGGWSGSDFQTMNGKNYQKSS
ncbi:hypothetical protein ACJ72_04030 [Emergomyces africanus]|uniref:Uncharacterized protein n=1 Tax=Emergomyces africanus TaxID=1955775 RepID=A0A1B7NXY1_9EURO|nr:hypothetical protein ACJ72_04030 [Emergomyces africanus]